MSMRVIDRTRIATGDPVILDELQGHLRIEAGEIPGAMAYASAAGDEVARFADLALLTETIVAETDDTPPAILPLPIGPAQADATVTVESVAEDGSTTTISTGWHLRPGRHPELRFAETPEAQIRVTYQAGYGIDAQAVPRDLRFAVMDQALRLFDRRGDMDDNPRLAPSTARICARYRRVSVGARV